MATEFPEVVKKIDAAGHEVGCHSFKHVWLNTMTEEELEEDTRKAIDALEHHQVLLSKARTLILFLIALKYGIKSLLSSLKTLSFESMETLTFPVYSLRAFAKCSAR